MNPLTHTHTYASKKTDFNSDSSLTDSAYRALLLLLLFFLIFQLAVGFQTHSHMLMHAHTRTLRQNNKNIRFQVPPAIVQYMRTLHAHTHRIHAQNVVCTTVCILYFSHSHHIEFQLHTHTWTACIICAHTRNFVHVWVRARVFVYIYVDCYWTLTFSSTCHAHRNKIYRNYERHIPNKIRKTSNWAWKSFGKHGTYSQQIEAELLATYIFFENSITLITTTTILNSPFFSFSLS